MKSLLRGSVLLVAGEFVSRVLLLLFTAILARVLGLETLASLTVTQTILAYATVAGDAGLTAHAVRRLSAGEDQRTVIRETSSSQIVLAGAGLVICVPIAAWVDDAYMVLLLAAGPLAVAAAPTYLLQANSRMGLIAASRIASAVVTAGGGSAILHFTQSVWAVIGYTLGAFSATAVIVVGAKVGFLGFLRSLTLHVRLRWLAESRWLIAQSLTVHVYASALLLFGTFLIPQAQFIELATALRLQLLFLVPANILQTVLLPLFTKNKIKLSSVAPLVALLSCAIPIAVQLRGNEMLILAFGDEAGAARDQLFLLSIQVPVAYSTVTVLTYLIANGKYSDATISYLAALAAQVVYAVIVGIHRPAFYPLALLVGELVFLSLLCSDTYRMHRPNLKSGAR